MNSELQHITYHLKECFDGRPWYGDSLMKKLGDIDWQNVNKAMYGKKSIAVLVKHMINWRVFVLKKLQGDADYDLVIDGPTDWSEVHIKDQMEWKALLSELKDTQESILEILSYSSDDLLRKKVPGKTYTFGNVVPSLTQHDIYHLGQIAMLNAMKEN